MGLGSRIDDLAGACSQWLMLHPSLDLLVETFNSLITDVCLAKSNFAFPT